MKEIRLGLLAYATNTGLGILTRNIYKHLRPAKTMLIDLSDFNGMPVHDDWYDETIRTNGTPTNAQIDAFLDGLDVVFVCETPLNYYLFQETNRRGIVTVLQYNYEYLDYLDHPNLPKPTVFAAPSLWNIRKMDEKLFPQVTPLPVPIDLTVLPRRTIVEARTFFHIAGRPVIHDRNGTLDFIAAADMIVRKDLKFIVYCQIPTPEIERAVAGTRVELLGELPDYHQIYERGDILVLPRRYGGLCLPAQEAVGAGIPVLMPNIDPNYHWLPEDWLIPIHEEGHHSFRTHSVIDVYTVDVDKLAQRMADLNSDPERVHEMHEQAKRIGASLSWETMTPRYEAFLEDVCASVRS